MYLSKAVKFLTIISGVAAVEHATHSAVRGETSHRDLKKGSKGAAFPGSKKIKKAKSSECPFQVNTYLQWNSLDGRVEVDYELRSGGSGGDIVDRVDETLYTNGFLTQTSGQSPCFDEGDDVDYAEVKICTDDCNGDPQNEFEHVLIQMGGITFDDLASILDNNDDNCCYFRWEKGAESFDADCTREAYRRVLSEGDEQRKLFSLMEGDELDYHVNQYEEKKDTGESFGLCHNPGSIHHGKDTTHQNCFDPANQDSSLLEEHTKEVDEYEPWVVPSHEGATLLAENPGIWTIDNFLNDEELEKLEGLVNKYGHEHDMFGPCKSNRRHSINAHPSENKVCFKISPEKVCEGPYDVSKCDTKTEDEDSVFIDMILARFRTLWPTSVTPLEYAKFQISQGNTAPVDLHADRFSISFVMYLNDGGASMIFPRANVTVEPQKGKVHTWLNLYEDGTRNPMADHAVQAHPSDAGERGVMLLSFESTVQDILASAE